MRRFVLPTRWTSLLTALVFAANMLCPLSLAQAQTVLNLPLPGVMVRTTDGYNPPLLGGMVLHPENPFQFDFILQTGDERLAGPDLQAESTRLIKYFLTALTVPEDQQWVNLSPFERDRIIPSGFDQTEMGRDMLAQDYLLKQLSASLLNPEERVGQEFWQRVYAQAAQRFGTTQIPVATFNKVWIVPEAARVYADGNVVYVLDGHLKVMLEEDYVAAGQGRAGLPLGPVESTAAAPADEVSAEALAISTRIMREIVIPQIEREVNQGRTFSGLRQIFQSVILAKWYKENLRDSLLNRAYSDQARLAGVDVDDPAIKDQIYQQYLQAFRQGVYNLIREDYDPAAGRKIPRRYFSGGVSSLMQGLRVDVTTASSAIAGAPVRGGRTLLLRSRLQIPQMAESRPPASSPVDFGWRRQDFAANAGPVYLRARTLSGLTPEEFDRHGIALKFVDPNIDSWKERGGDAVLLFILAADADGKLVEQLAGLQYFEPESGTGGAARTGRRYVPGEWRGAGLDNLLLAKTQSFLRVRGYRQVTLGPAIPDQTVEKVTVELTGEDIADWVTDALIPVSFNEQARLQILPETGEVFPGRMELAETESQSVDEVIDWQDNAPLRQAVDRLRADPADVEAQATLRAMIMTGQETGPHRQSLQALVDLGDEKLAKDIFARMITQARAENRVDDALLDAFKFLLEKTGWKLGFRTFLDPSEYAINGIIKRLSLEDPHYLVARPGELIFEKVKRNKEAKVLFLEVRHEGDSGIKKSNLYDRARMFVISEQIFKNGNMPQMSPEERSRWKTRLNIPGRHVVILPSVTVPEMSDFIEKYEAFFSAYPNQSRPLVIVAPRNILSIAELGLDRFASMERRNDQEAWPDLSEQDFWVLNTRGELRGIMGLATFDSIGEDRGLGEVVLQDIPTLFWDGPWELNRWTRDSLVRAGAIRRFDQKSFNEFMLNIDHLDEQRRAVQAGAELLQRQYELVTAEMVTAMTEEILPDLLRGMQEAQPVSSPLGMEQAVGRLREDPADARAGEALREMILTSPEAGQRRAALRALVDHADPALVEQVLTAVIDQARRQDQAADAQVDVLKFLLEETGWRLGFMPDSDPSRSNAIKGIIERMSLGHEHYIVEGDFSVDGSQTLSDKNKYNIQNPNEARKDKTLFVGFSPDKLSGIEKKLDGEITKQFLTTLQILKNGNMPQMSLEDKNWWRRSLHLQGRQVIMLASITATESKEFVKFYRQFFSEHPDFPRPLVVVAHRDKLTAQQLGVDQFRYTERNDRFSSWPDLSEKDFLLLNTSGELREMGGMADFALVGEDSGVGEFVLQDVPTLFWDGKWLLNRWTKDTLAKEGAIQPFGEETFSEFMSGTYDTAGQRAARERGAEILLRQYEWVIAQVVVGLSQDLLPDLLKKKAERAALDAQIQPEEGADQAAQAGTLSEEPAPAAPDTDVPPQGPASTAQLDTNPDSWTRATFARLGRETALKFQRFSQAGAEARTAVEEIAGLEASAWDGEFRDALLVFATATRDGVPVERLIGYHVFQNDFNGGMIHQTLFVDADWDGSGLRDMVLGQTLKVLRGEGLERFVLDVDRRDNAALALASRAAEQWKDLLIPDSVMRTSPTQITGWTVDLTKLDESATLSDTVPIQFDETGRVSAAQPSGQDQPVSSPAGREDVGGVDFNPAGFAIDQQGPGVDIPVPSSPAGWQEMDIPGLVPFIFHVAPISDLPLFLSTQVPPAEEVLSRR